MYLVAYSVLNLIKLSEWDRQHIKLWVWFLLDNDKEFSSFYGHFYCLQFLSSFVKRTKVWKNRRFANYRARDSKSSLMTRWWQYQPFLGGVRQICPEQLQTYWGTEGQICYMESGLCERAANNEGRRRATRWNGEALYFIIRMKKTTATTSATL